MADVTLTLSEAEGLLLFDWLATVNEDESMQAHPALRRVLWDLESALESALPAAVAPDYTRQLEAARAKLGAD